MVSQLLKELTFILLSDMFTELPVQVRFENNIPLKCCKIKCTLRLNYIAYCRSGITPTSMRLLHIVDIYMCVKVVFGSLDDDDPNRIGGCF